MAFTSGKRDGRGLINHHQLCLAQPRMVLGLDVLHSLHIRRALSVRSPNKHAPGRATHRTCQTRALMQPNALQGLHLETRPMIFWACTNMHAGSCKWTCRHLYQDATATCSQEFSGWSHWQWRVLFPDEAQRHVLKMSTAWYVDNMSHMRLLAARDT